MSATSPLSATAAQPSVEVDCDGYLVCADDWTPDVAVALARRDGLVLEEAHWSIIRLLRVHWCEQLTAPHLRTLVKLASKEFGNERGSARSLHKLFPGGPAKQGCRYAGLPQPDGCV